MFVLVWACTHKYISVRLYTYTRMNAYKYAHTHKSKQTYTLIHTHTCTTVVKVLRNDKCGLESRAAKRWRKRDASRKRCVFDVYDVENAPCAQLFDSAYFCVSLCLCVCICG